MTLAIVALVGMPYPLETERVRFREISFRAVIE
jgi:hypothetical protein